MFATVPRYRLTVAAVLVACGLVACTPKTETRGNLPREYQLEQLEVGRSTQQEVADLLGSPSTIGTFESTTWYYISRRMEQWAFLPKEVAIQKIVVLYFDDQGVLQRVEQYNEDDIRQVAHVKRETPTAGHSMTVLEQLFGNLGRFNK